MIHSLLSDSAHGISWGSPPVSSSSSFSIAAVAAVAMASGFPERDFRGALGIGGGSVIQIPFQQRSAGGLLKRSLTELERQQQMQHAMFLRSVKQRTHAASLVDLSSFVSPASSITSTTTTSGSSSFGIFPRVQNAGNAEYLSFLTPPQPQKQQQPPAAPERKSSAMRNQLAELERQLLDDDDDEEAEASASGSAVTALEWGETMQQLLSPQPPPAAAAAAMQNALSSPSSSSSSSSASCSPAFSAPSRQLLLDTATAIAEGNMGAAVGNLTVLKRLSNPRGDPEQRLTAMMTAALLSRVNPPVCGGGHHPIAELCTAEHQMATQMLYDLSPCFKLALVASNLAILDATADSSKIHILDFDVGQGGQYAALLHALVDRHRRGGGGGKPPSVKITAVSDPTSPLNCFGVDRIGSIKTVGDRIARLAERAGVGLRFSVLNRRAAELDAETLGCEPGEALAVNFAFHLSRIADESVSPANPRDELLRLARRLSPRVVAVSEQEVSGNTAPFAARFAEACGHYGAVLESLDATAARESSERARAEGCLARRAANSVAREGAERVERCEVFGKWRARIGMAGLRPVALGPAVSEPVRNRISSLRSNPGFTVKEEAGGLCFGWLGRVVTVASAWR